MDIVTYALLKKLIDAKASLVNGKVPAEELPSYIDDVEEYASKSSFPSSGEEGKIYVALNTGYSYRWSGSRYTWINSQDFPLHSITVTDGGTISDSDAQEIIQQHQQIIINGTVNIFSCDDGTNYQYYSVKYDTTKSVNVLTVITVNKTTWVATLHTSNWVLAYDIN